MWEPADVSPQLPYLWPLSSLLDGFDYLVKINRTSTHFVWNWDKEKLKNLLWKYQMLNHFLGFRARQHSQSSCFLFWNRALSAHFLQLQISCTTYLLILMRYMCIINEKPILRLTFYSLKGSLFLAFILSSCFSTSAWNLQLAAAALTGMMKLWSVLYTLLHDCKVCFIIAALFFN